ncbi:MAG: hypothetical protein HXS46_19825 [Theionarchaea archaeon]|nr:hypothetical protein [Theionarchaea archaeon]
MVPDNGLLQPNTSSAIGGFMEFLENLYSEYKLFILTIIAVIILYFVITRLLFRGTVYKTAQKEPSCFLTMAGRERSLEYLEKFGEMRGIEAQVIRYLRKHGSVPLKHLEKTFGREVIQKLLKNGMIAIV